MTVEEVCKMMDAITEGKNFHHTFDGKVGSHELSITGDGFQIRAEGDGTVCDDPRTAREIAAALVTWASTKDGIIFDQLGAAANLTAMRKERAKIVTQAKAIKEETMNASVWDEDDDAPMRRIGRIDDMAYEILKELGEVE